MTTPHQDPLAPALGDSSPHRTCAGFTLPELLLASVLGAMLLTAMAVNTFGYTGNLDYLEKKAGVTSEIDPVLRQITRSIREGWLVEKPSAKRLKITEPGGAVTEYYLEGKKFWIKRPNGDLAVLHDDILDLSIDVATAPRLREATEVLADGAWYSKSAAAPLALEVPAGGQLALGFTTPVLKSDVPLQIDPDEQVLSVQSSIVELPVAWVAGSGAHQFQISLYESWAPGKAKPTGSVLASLQVPGSSLPQAVAAGGGWQVPAQVTPFGLSAVLQPGTGYTLVLKALGNSKIVVPAAVVSPSSSLDEVALMASGGSWVVQPSSVPFTIKGPHVFTATASQEVVTQVTMTVYPTNRPLQQRSASVLSQVTADDPWLGVVPGETQP